MIPTTDDINAFHQAMMTQKALSACLRSALEDATITGIMPSTETLEAECHRLECYEEILPNGRVLWDSSELGWCTLKHHYGWSLPTNESLDEIMRLCVPEGRVIEIGAGSGYLAAVLRARGLDIAAYDTGVWKIEQWKHKWHPIINQDACDAILENPSVPVLMSWVAPSLSENVLHAIYPNTLVIRIGDDNTGDKVFNTTFIENIELLSITHAWGTSGRPDVMMSGQKRATPIPYVHPSTFNPRKIIAVDTTLSDWWKAWYAENQPVSVPRCGR
jgi:hypothetical protein